MSNSLVAPFLSAFSHSEVDIFPFPFVFGVMPQPAAGGVLP